MMVRGYETCTLNIIPQLKPRDIDDPDFDLECQSLSKDYERFCKARDRLNDIYHTEFMTTLITQAIDKKDRYKPVNHKCLQPGDIVLLIEPNIKRPSYPMARVQKVDVNSLGEVTAAYVFKGSTKELVYRHVNSLILLILSEGFKELSGGNIPSRSVDHEGNSRPMRKAAGKCKQKLKNPGNYA